MPVPVPDPPRRVDRRRTFVAIAVLALTAFNLTFRLGQEMVQVWDESLYATSALEMIQSGNWVVTTFQGTVDYVNSKPPLNTWLIAGSFTLFGVNPAAMRLPAVLSAWCTVLVVYLWTRRRLGPAVAALAALILATTYGFIYVHSGRSSNTDVHITLLVTLAFVTATSARALHWRAAAFGLISAGVFMLKGPAALVFVAPFLVAHAVALVRAGEPLEPRLGPLTLGAVCFTVPIASWAYARWHADGWLFFTQMIGYDLLARGLTAVEGHGESLFYYFDVVQRYQYEWLITAAAAALLAPRAMRGLARACAARGVPLAMVAAWAAGTFVVPTLVTTKLAWYVNGIYPLLAITLAVIVHAAWHELSAHGQVARARLVVALVVIAAVAAEGRMAWQSYRKLDLGRSAQGLLVGHADAVRGRRVFARACPRPEWFLARAAGSRCVVARDPDVALSIGDANDLWLDQPGLDHPGLTLVVANRRSALYARR